MHFSIACIVEACIAIRCLPKGIQIHAEIARKSFLENNALLGTSLVHMYAKCDAIGKARESFDRILSRDLASWNVVIGAYVRVGLGYESISCFERSKCESFAPSAITFVCVLKACGSLRDEQKGHEIHAQIVALGLVEKNVLVGNAIVSMYAKCGVIGKAQEVFDQIQFRTIVSWTSLVGAYTQHGHGEEAFKCFRLMQCEGISPNKVTFIYILKACGDAGALQHGQQTHAHIIRQLGFLGNDILIGNALIDMYAKCGWLQEAHQMFDEILVHDLVSWNVLIAGYAEHSHYSNEEAFHCFERMQCESFAPNSFTFVCILKACGRVGSINKGNILHLQILQHGFLHKDTLVGNALVDMYAKCGLPRKAHKVFDELWVRDVFSWTMLLAGYAHQGSIDIVIGLFNTMIREDIEPSVVTFTMILTTCSHSGLLEKGQMFLEIMRKGYETIPTLEHYTCLVDLFGRAGNFDKVIRILEKMPTCNYIPTWIALLSACRKWGNPELGEMACEHAIQLLKNFPRVSICMNKIYEANSVEEEWRFRNN